jgi:hypothetical protein
MANTPDARFTRFVRLSAGCLVVAAQLVGAAQEQPLPAARELVTRHVAAIGGEAAFRAVKSIRVRGTFEMAAQNISGALEILSARPDKLLTRVEISAVGHVETGFDGKVGWTIDPLSGPALATGRQLSELGNDAWFDSVFHAPDRVREMKTVSRETFSQRPAFKVHVAFVGGTEQFEYYDAETGLQIGLEGSRETPMGVLPTSTVLRDYKKFGSLLQPTTLVQRAMGIEQTFHITSCEYDVVPANAFELPAQVKALIK